jgi:flagellar basal-body rod protein FlgB
MWAAFMRGMIEGLYDRESYQMAKVLMDASLLRHQAVASNIANVETPGYQRVQLDPGFDQQLMNALESGNTQAMGNLNPQIMVDDRTPAVRPDGNNVQLADEMLAMNRNALEYEFLSRYMSKSFSKIKTAITGTVNNS